MVQQGNILSHLSFVVVVHFDIFVEYSLCSDVILRRVELPSYQIQGKRHSTSPNCKECR